MFSASMFHCCPPSTGTSSFSWGGGGAYDLIFLGWSHCPHIFLYILVNFSRFFLHLPPSIFVGSFKSTPFSLILYWCLYHTTTKKARGKSYLTPFTVHWASSPSPVWNGQLYWISWVAQYSTLPHILIIYFLKQLLQLTPVASI